MALTEQDVGTPDPVSRFRHRALIAGLVALLLVGVSLVNQTRQRSLDKPVPPTPTPSPTIAPPVPFRHGLAAPWIGKMEIDGTPIDIVGGGYLLALTEHPSRVYRLGPQEPLSWMALNDVAPGSYRLILDSLQVKLFLLGHANGGTTISRLDPLSLSLISHISVPFEVTDAVASYNTLWVASAGALYAVPDTGGRPRRLLQGSVQAMSVDNLDNRVVVALQTPRGTDLQTFSIDDLSPGPHTSLPLQQASLATMSDDLWVAGTGDNSRGTLVHLNSTTLARRPAGHYPIYGVAAMVWPGTSALWVGGDSEVACMDPVDGQVLTTSDGIRGPLVTGLGFAFALTDNGLRTLDLSRTACYEG